MPGSPLSPIVAGLTLLLAVTAQCKQAQEAHTASGGSIGSGGAHGADTGGNRATGGADAGLVGSGGTGVDAKEPPGSGGAWSNPHCAVLPVSCGPSHDEDCCTSLTVPGGTFYRSFDGVNRLADGTPLNTNKSYPATVSTFALDKFEVTVGRFREFVDAGMGIRSAAPPAGTGAHPLIPGTGWDPAWNTHLPMDTVNLTLQVQCSTMHTWTDSPGANESLPINCTPWWLSLAFCIWDEGRLPTEAEWNYAAAGGDEQREYPWGNSGPDSSKAVYGCQLLDGSTTDCDFSAILPVGSKPAGNGKYGHADLAGSMWEWVFDSYGTYPVPCVDCAANSTAANLTRVYRGGYFVNPYVYLRSSYRADGYPMFQINSHGIRCARQAR